MILNICNMRTKDQILLENAYEEVYKNAINEAKKKINPWAVAKSVAKKKHLGPEKEEEIVKGVKKSAKKSGNKITSDKIIATEEYDEDLSRGSTNMPHGQGYPNVKESDEERQEVIMIDFMADSEDDGVSFPAYVTAYDIVKEFGGHEEGGWWYTEYTPLQSIQVNDEEQAESAANRLYDKHINGIDGKLKIFIEKESGSQQLKEKPHYE